MIRYPETHHIHPYPTGEDILDLSLPPFRVWIPEKPVLVLGYSQEPEQELNLAAVEAAKIPVYKRKGGGGTVFLSPNTVCVALRMRRKTGFGLHEYFSEANGWIQSALKDSLNVDLTPRGISDLALDDRKILGSSLYLPRDCAVYLASILVNVPLSILDQYLSHPTREPDYRQGRSHSNFVRNLNEIPGLEHLMPVDIKHILDQKFSDLKLDE